MRKEFLKKMEAELKQEHERLKNDLEEFTKQNPRNREDYITTFENIGDKEDENAEEVATYSTNLSLERSMESALRDVDRALERMAKGTYGVCKYCSKEISEKRLEARPSSSSCIECKKSFTQEL
jgi:RNA polymerase-binding protein DksA